MKTTVGQLLINEGLPEEMRDYSRQLDKKSIKGLLTEVAEKDEKAYARILKHLQDVGRSVSSSRGLSVSLEHLVATPAKKKLINDLRRKNQADRLNKKMTDEQKRERITQRSAETYEKIKKLVLDEGIKSKSPYARQVLSGARGNPGQLSSLVGADLIVADHKDEPAPFVVYNSYSEGLSPAEYWASSYGTRKGIIDVKHATADSGYLAKQLVLAAQRKTVVDEEPIPHRLPVGFPVSAKDSANIGAVLAQPVKGMVDGKETVIPANTVITPRLHRQIQQTAKGKDILVHSPLTSYTTHGGVDRLSAGRRESGELADIGDRIGVTSAQSISQPLSQGALDSKHRSGAGGDRVSRAGFAYIDKLLQGPSTMEEAGPLSPIEGTVDGIREAPQGGHYVKVNGEEIYLHRAINPIVKIGQKLQQGDSLSDGVPHPQELVKYLGIGGARREYMRHLMEAFDNSNISVNRRNAEVLVSSLINHVRVGNPEGVGTFMLDDLAPYDQLSASYKKREGTQLLPLKKTKGKYLEEPVLHYTIGTKVTPRVMDELKSWNIQDLNVHDADPDFEPQFERLLTSSSHDPDWQVGLAGFYTGRSMGKSIQRMRTSSTDNASFVPALAQAAPLGKSLPKQQNDGIMRSTTDKGSS